MKLTLEQSNIETAVRAYLQATYGISLRNKETVMEFKAGRGSNGVSVLVSVNDVTIPGEVASVESPVGTQKAPKVSAADKVTASIQAAPEGSLGALIAANSTGAVPAETPVPVADLPSTTPAETPVVEAGEVPSQENGTANPYVAPEGTATLEAEVPAVTTEVAVQEEAEVAAPAAAPVTTTGLFS